MVGFDRPMGSSPLTRGKRFAPIALTEWTGLIPAHAGKTSFGEVPGPAWGAHPRSRGENIIEAADPISPWAHPRSRGENRDPSRPTFGNRGLIPAHAGKTVEVCLDRMNCTAHPRSRGENHHRKGYVK